MLLDAAPVPVEVTKTSRNLSPGDSPEGVSAQFSGTVYEPSVFGVGEVCAEAGGVRQNSASRRNDSSRKSPGWPGRAPVRRRAVGAAQSPPKPAPDPVPGARTEGTEASITRSRGHRSADRRGIATGAAVGNAGERGEAEHAPPERQESSRRLAERAPQGPRKQVRLPASRIIGSRKRLSTPDAAASTGAGPMPCLGCGCARLRRIAVSEHALPRRWRAVTADAKGHDGHHRMPASNRFYDISRPKTSTPTNFFLFCPRQPHDRR